MRFRLPVFVILAAMAASLSTSYAAPPKGLPAVEHPKDNPPTAAKISLGKQLYFDKRLSRDSTISCASCHDPAKGYSNGAQFATGVGGKKGGRNSPTVINAAYYRFPVLGRSGAEPRGAGVGPDSEPDRNEHDAQRSRRPTE